jgi:hypothetical protein
VRPRLRHHSSFFFNSIAPTNRVVVAALGNMPTAELIGHHALLFVLGLGGLLDEGRGNGRTDHAPTRCS